MSDTPPLSSGRRAIARLTQASVAHPWRVLAVAALLTAASVRLASGLEIRSNFDELLPSDIPSVAHIQEMVRRVGGDGSVLLVLASSDSVPDARGKFDDRPIDLAAAKKLAPVLVRELLALGPDKIRAVQWNMRDVQGWFEDHWPLFASTDELTRARDGLRAEIKKRKLEANPLAVPLDDDDAPASDPPGDALHANDRPATAGPPAAKAADPIAEWLDPKHPLPREQVAARFSQYDDGFLVNPAKTALVLNVRPAGTSLGVSEARRLIDEMRAVADKHQAELAAGHLRVGFGGSTATFIADYEAITHDVFGTAALCFSLVILSILLFFRDLRSTLSLGLAILIAVAITFGLTKLVIGYLNTQTAFLGVIVAGNGINYGLIYLARVKQLRQKGVPLGPACVEGALTCAQSTLLASAASSVSFGVLIIAANRGFRHFGFIGGLGMLLCWICTFALVPALLSLWRRSIQCGPRRRRQCAFPAGCTRSSEAGADRRALRARLRRVDRALLPAAARRDGAQPRQPHQRPPRGRGAPLQRSRPVGAGQVDRGTLRSRFARGGQEFCDAIRARMKEPSPIVGVPTIAGLIPTTAARRWRRRRRASSRPGSSYSRIESQLDDGLLQHLDKDQAARIQQVRAQLAAQAEVTAASAPVTLLDPFRERDGQVGRLAVITRDPGRAPRAGAEPESLRGGGAQRPGARQARRRQRRQRHLQRPPRRHRQGGPAHHPALVPRRLRAGAGLLPPPAHQRRGAGHALHRRGADGRSGRALRLQDQLLQLHRLPDHLRHRRRLRGQRRGAGARAPGRTRCSRSPRWAARSPLCSFTSIIGYASLLVSINRALRSFGHYGMIGELTSIVSALVLLPALLVIAQRHRRESRAAQPLTDRP